MGSRAPPPSAIDTSKRPFVLVWEVTQACELACKHCRADAKPKRHPDELSTAEAIELFDDISTFGEGQLVVLSGGDPFARDDLLDLIAAGTNRGLQMTVTPSGTTSLTNERIGALESAGLRRMALSLDGATPAAHDEFRQERGSFEETIRAARQATDAGIPLQINTTVCQETVGELPGLSELVASLDAVLWSVFFLVPVGRGRVIDPITPDRAEMVMEWLADLTEEVPYGIKTTEAPHYRRVLLQRKGNGDSPARRQTQVQAQSPDTIGRRSGISAGDGFVFVSHLGEVYPSGFLPASAGNVRDRSIVDIYRTSERFRDLRDPDALSGKCGACEFRNVCGGSRSRAFAYTGDPLAADPLCNYRPPTYDGPSPPQEIQHPPIQE